MLSSKRSVDGHHFKLLLISITMNKDLLLFLAILSKVLILIYTPSINSDVWYYADLAQHMIHHQLPYFDFKFEYPPLAILPIWIPALIQDTLSHFNKDKFVEIFRCLNFVLDLMFLFYLKYKFESKNNYSSYLLFNICLSIIMAPLIYDRLDLIFGLFLFMTFVTLGERKKVEGLYYACAAIPFKLISVLFVPFFGISFIKDKDFDLKVIIQKILIPGLIFLFMIISLFQFKFLDFLSYHNERGIQIESTWATLHFMIQKLSHHPMMIEYSFGAQHLKNVPWWLTTIANYSFLVILLILMTLFYFKDIPLRRILFSTLMIFLAFSKVFSPQFLLWLIPLFILEQNSIKDLLIFGVMCLLTMFIFVDYGALMHQKTWAWWCLVARNGLLIYLVGTNIWHLQRFSGRNKTGLFQGFAQTRRREVLQD